MTRKRLKKDGSELLDSRSRVVIVPKETMSIEERLKRGVVHEADHHTFGYDAETAIVTGKQATHFHLSSIFS